MAIPTAGKTKALNIYDIAQEANVSIATVSRVLNDKGNVSLRTLERVRAVLDKHHYRRNASAVAMATKQARTIAIVTVDVRIPHYASTVYEVEQYFSRRDYHVVVSNTGGTLQSTQHSLKIIAEKKIDGLIFVGSVYNDLCRDEIIRKSIADLPVVLANGSLNRAMTSSVLANDALGIAMCVDHLQQRGARRLLYVQDLTTTAAEHKKEGFVRACDYFQLNRHDVTRTEYGLNGGRRIADLLHQHSQRYDGVVFGEDLTACGAITPLLRYGFSIGSDLLITGCNNSIYTTIAEPALTSVDNKGVEVARKCAELLERMLTDSVLPDNVTVHPDLVIRASTAGSTSAAAPDSSGIRPCSADGEPAVPAETRISGCGWLQQHPDFSEQGECPAPSAGSSKFSSRKSQRQSTRHTKHTKRTDDRHEPTNQTEQQ